MEYISRFKSTVLATAAQMSQNVSQALPGNPIFREYTVQAQCATAGPGNCWKIYPGWKNSTKKKVSVWLFEKKFVENWSKYEKEYFLDLLKRGVSQLTKLRHPRILLVEKPIEETRDNFAFCTEPVFASLADCFSGVDNSLAPPDAAFNYALQEIEIKYGLFQLVEGLLFLHNDTRIVHANISPFSILINEKGEWKIGGFEFFIAGVTSESEREKVRYQVPKSEHRKPIMNPDLNYCSPEFIESEYVDTSTDIFSFGGLMYTVFNKGKLLFDCKSSINQFNQNIVKIKNPVKEYFEKLPAIIKDDVMICLNFEPSLRPNALQLTKIPFFDDHLLKVLIFLDTINAMDNGQKIQFFKGLSSIIAQFPKKTLLQKVFPTLAENLSLPMLIPFILPSIFIIIETAMPNEFSTLILPSLIPVFSIQTPYQIGLQLVQKMELFIEKMTAKDIKDHLLPLIYSLLMSENQKIQELCLSEVPNISKFVDRDSMRSQLLPRLIRIALEGNVLSIRIQSLLCIANIMPNLEPWMVHDQILPSLPKINSKEPGLLMAILGLYKIAHESEKFGISREHSAKSVLPFLISTSIEATLNLQQFEQFMSMIRILLNKLENEQRQKLQQLSVTQEEQRSIANFVDTLNAKAKQTSATNLMDDLFFNAQEKNFSHRLTSDKGSAMLSLSEKKRLALATNDEKGDSIRGKKSQSSNDLELLVQSIGKQNQTISEGTFGSTGQAINSDDLISEFLPKHSQAQNLQMQRTSGLKLSHNSPAIVFPSLPQPPTARENLLVQRNQPVMSSLKSEGDKTELFADLLSFSTEKQQTSRQNMSNTSDPKNNGLDYLFN